MNGIDGLVEDVEEASAFLEDIEKMVGLLDKQRALVCRKEQELSGLLLAGGSITREVRLGGRPVPREVLEYCFVNFPSTQNNMNGAVSYTSSAIDRIPSVLKLMSAVNSVVGQEAMVCIRGTPRHKGIITGPAAVKTRKMGDYHHRELHIPVSDSLVYRNGPNWEKDDAQYLEVDKRIFATPSVLIAGSSSWHGEDPEGTFYAGGMGPGTFDLYLGGEATNAAQEAYKRRIEWASVH